MIIGLNGGMGVGKSTAIKILQEYLKPFGRDVVTVKYAQPLYDIQEMIYERISSVYKRPVDFVKDRKLLQWIGTDWGRDIIRSTLWVDIWRAEVEAIFADYKMQGELTPVIVCDDCRFDNEAETLKSLEAPIIKIVSDKSAVRIDTTAGLSNHASEQGINPSFVDFTVTNNGTIEEYAEQLVTIFNKMNVGSRGL